MWKRIQRRIARWACPPAPPASETETGRRLLAQLRQFNLWPVASDPNLRGDSNPVDHMGTAFRLAKHYGIEVRGGITSVSCQAYLPEDRCKRGPDEHGLWWNWIDRPDPREAICAALVNSKARGLL